MSMGSREMDVRMVSRCRDDVRGGVRESGVSRDGVEYEGLVRCRLSSR